MVVPYAVGGSTDVMARNVAEQMKASMGQPVIIENVTGAGGSIATGRVARAAADGYTLSFGQRVKRNSGSDLCTPIRSVE
jgi:tripartite-type tricarboxylate transporter receptor subunit TctC